MFKNFLKLGMFIGIITSSYAFNLTEEAKWQDIQRKFIKKFIKNDFATIKDDFLKLINNELNIQDVLRLGIISRLQGTEFLTQAEIDTLWLNKGKRFFQDILVEYLSGLIIGNEIVKRYKTIDLQTETNSLSDVSKKTEKLCFVYSKAKIFKKIKELCHDFLLRFTTDTNNKNQYLQRIIEMITSEQTTIEIEKKLQSNSTLYTARAFDLSIAFEYAMKWFDTYLNTDKERIIFEHKLLSLQSKILILIGLFSLNENDPKTYSKTLAAFTLAAAKNKHKKINLDYLVDFLIKNKQTQAFEPFLFSSSK
jgi:hypothetical protein